MIGQLVDSCGAEWGVTPPSVICFSAQSSVFMLFSCGFHAVVVLKLMNLTQVISQFKAFVTTPECTMVLVSAIAIGASTMFDEFEPRI